MDVVETCGEGTLSIPGTSVQCSFPSIDDDEVVGFKKYTASIMQKLTQGTQELDVISIFGMPGLGKTTLAREVYNNPSIINYFDVKVWCSVSQEYDRKKLLADIFKQATRREIDEDDDIADIELGIIGEEGSSRRDLSTESGGAAVQVALHFHITDLPSCPLFPIVEVRFQSFSLVATYMGFWDSVGWESYFVFPSNLKHMCVSGDFLTEEMVLNIARLKKLESLPLKGGFPEWGKVNYYYWDMKNVEFPALKCLVLDTVRMYKWKASEESFPVLEDLVIRNCYYFKDIPPSFADIPTLQLIALYNAFIHLLFKL
ncbi:hypothetical protein H5410_033177 [Solanum commersonii]|uniref:NB-ARC domain-containing protein n=1 Tax=Solanum commersonii TaxID=4109 RepID=A0A9J5YPZ3_SOLCO|nr:hypothetical protein H5410_033177 [Solanum commersonii]